MKKIFILISVVIVLTVFYGCGAPTQNSSAQASSGITLGMLVFPNPYTFQPKTCVEWEEYPMPSVSSSSEVAISWDRDSLGSAASQILWVRPSADVTQHGVWFVFCNNSTESITIPGGSAGMYEVLNAGGLTANELPRLEVRP